MAYSEELAQRVRTALGDELGVTEKKMFGGLCFLLRGNMICGIVKDELMVRVGPEQYGAALQQPYAREMDFTGRAMKGMVYIAPAGITEYSDLSMWVQRGVTFAGSLPPK
ncbi:MAG: TfoX/Sxy family protein [Caldilineaceae bacterium]